MLGARHEVGDQACAGVSARVVRGFARDDGDLRELGALGDECALDLCELDTKASDLDLIVRASDVDERTISATQCEIAAAVHAVALRTVRTILNKGIGDKPLSGEPGATEIAAG